MFPITSLSSLFFLLLLTSSAPTKQETPPLFPIEAHPTSSGYLPVSPQSASSLYYAFYEAKHLSQPHLNPILLWLQGGPGCSSMIGNLFELGPWVLRGGNDTALQLEPNPYSWNSMFGLLFVDNPIGTGFSIADKAEDIPTNQTAVADHLWFALQAFFSSNPSFRTRPFYITGESYAGKYIPAAAYFIQWRNPHVEPSRRINLKGIAIGNGLTHPIDQVRTHADSAYYAGLVNKRQWRELKEMQREAVKLIKAKQWAAATDARNRVLNSLQNVTGLATLYDLRRKTPYKTGRVTTFLQLDKARDALGVTNSLPFEECSAIVSKALHVDVMKSVKFLVEALLKEGSIRILLYQGQFDLRDGVASTEAWVEQMGGWKGLPRFLQADRLVWKIEDVVAGYVQRWGQLTHVVVGDAGHLVPADQGRRSQEMIDGWVNEVGIFRGEGNGDSLVNASSIKKYYM